ncbi:MAG: type IV pilus modification protein PilV [Gallionella sp.]|nr:type IV pilus modification protein PilV [Gallionella sp.]
MRNKFICSSFAIRLQLGFSMLEVLITLVIIATALLGTAGLQAYALKSGQSSQLRNQAIFLASDIAERMEANKAGAVAGNYTLAATSSVSVAPAVDCSNTSCDPSELAAWDVFQWESNFATLLPQVSSWEISSPACTGVAPLPSLCNYTIFVAWSDRRIDTTYAAFNAASSVGINATGTSELFSYTTTRSIAN